MICKAPSGAAQPVVDILHAVDVRWSKFPRPPSQQNPRSSKRSPRGPVASTRVRIRWRSARVPRTDQVRLVAAAVRNPADGRSARTYSRHHPACQRSHCGPARYAHVRTIRARVRGDAAVHGGGFPRGRWRTPSPCRRSLSRIISSRSSPRPAPEPAASWSAKSSSSTTCPAGKTSQTVLSAGSRRHHRSVLAVTPDPARTPRSWPDRFTLSSPPRRLTDRAPGTKRSRVQIQSPRPVECLIGCTSR